MPLTDTAVRNAKPTGKPQKLADTEGLYLFISPTGGKLWRMDYRFAGKRKTLSIGKYPAVGLKDARARRDKAKEMLANGIDPSEQKKVNKRIIIEEERRNQNTFRLVALEWFDTYAPDLSEKHALKLRRYLENALFDVFGNKVITDIVPADILEAARPSQEKGRIQTAHRLVQLTGQVLQYAVIKGILNVNVATGITRALQPIRVTNYPAVTEPKEIGRLLRAIDHYEGYPSIVYFLKILPYVFTRPGELRLAEWEDINFENSLFIVPWHRMKTRKVNRKDHHVPLAHQVVALFRELQEVSGDGKFVFPSVASLK